MAIRSCDSDQLKNDVAFRSSGLTDCQKKVLDVVFGSSICEMSVDSEAQFGENLSESSKEGCSESPEASFNSASEDF